MAPIIEITGMKKRFGPNISVCNLNFAVEEEEFFGLLDPNFAGKTTTIHELSCLITPSDDSATISEYKILKNPLAMTQTVGILTENPSFYKRLIAQENMDFLAEVCKCARWPSLFYEM
jgi:ABC-2 type transport system ATP-binding protein